MTKSEIIKIQTALVANGYGLPMFGIDGSMGAETARAVMNFQEDNGLIGTGSLDAITVDLLNAAPSTKEVVGSTISQGYFSSMSNKRKYFMGASLVAAVWYFTKKK